MQLKKYCFFISKFLFFHKFCKYTHIVNCFPRNFWLSLLFIYLSFKALDQKQLWMRQMRGLKFVGEVSSEFLRNKFWRNLRSTNSMADHRQRPQASTLYVKIRFLWNKTHSGWNKVSWRKIEKLIFMFSLGYFIHKV